MKSFITKLAIVSVCAFLSGCGKSSATSAVNLSMIAAPVARALPEYAPTGRFTQTHLRSFTPTSFKLPIMKISIAGDNGVNEQILYRCAQSTEAQCLVDLSSQTELDAIKTAARSATPTAGTYTQVSIYTCQAGSGGSTATTAKVTGSGTGPTGTTWYTNTAAAVSIGSGTAQETDVGNWSCNTKTIAVPSGIVVGSGTLNLTVLVDNYMAANFGDQVSSGMGGCKLSGATLNGLCMTYPAMLAYVGTDTVTTKRFTIAHNQGGAATVSKANALIIVAVTSGGTPLMAYGRTLYTATSEATGSNTKVGSLTNAQYEVATGGPTYVTETNNASFVVSGSTIAFTQGASADTYAAKFATFNPAATHSSTVKSRDDVDTWNYLATLLP